MRAMDESPSNLIDEISNVLLKDQCLYLTYLSWVLSPVLGTGIPPVQPIESEPVTGSPSITIPKVATKTARSQPQLKTFWAISTSSSKSVKPSCERN